MDISHLLTAMGVIGGKSPPNQLLGNKMKRSLIFFLLMLTTTFVIGFQISAPQIDRSNRHEVNTDFPDMSEGLCIRVEVDKKHLCPGYMLVNFIMQNKTDSDIKIWERGNSWGAFNWQLEIKNEDQSTFLFGNLQDLVWTENCPSTLTISPNSEYKMDCKILLESVDIPYDPKGKEIFVPLGTNETQIAQWPKFLANGLSEIRGIYINQEKTSGIHVPRPEYKEPVVWVGKIASTWTKIPNQNIEPTVKTPIE